MKRRETKNFDADAFAKQYEFVWEKVIFESFKKELPKLMKDVIRKRGASGIAESEIYNEIRNKLYKEGPGYELSFIRNFLGISRNILRELSKVLGRST